MSLSTILSRELADFDSSWRVKDLQPIFVEWRDEPTFAATLVQLYQSELHIRHACLYLMKEWVRYTKLNTPEFKIVLPQLETEPYWPSVIYMLDLIPYMDMSEREWQKLEPTLERGLSHTNTFTRALFYEVYHSLTLVCPEYSASFLELCALEIKTEKASVCCKLKRILQYK